MQHRRCTGRRFVPLVTLLSVIVLLLGTPGAATAETANPDGSPPTLQDALTEAARAYTDAKARLDAAVAHQQQTEALLVQTRLRLTRLQAQAGTIAASAYRANAISRFNALLSASDPQNLLERMTALQLFTREQSIVLADLKTTARQADEQQAQIAQDVAIAKSQAAQMLTQKQKLEKILDQSTGGPSGVVVAAPTADPAPRNSDGSFPSQGCTQDDPTTTGCLTARTVHAYQEVKKAGFSHFVSCWRQQSWGEHPKGRACDWAAAKSGFGGVAAGGDRDYGNRLAGWLIGNSDRLGILYVIWFKQIWLPGVGWHAYHTEGGSPSGDHTNHVHMSIK